MLSIFSFEIYARVILETSFSFHKINKLKTIKYLTLHYDTTQYEYEYENVIKLNVLTKYP